jgi:hypothetical protein
VLKPDDLAYPLQRLAACQEVVEQMLDDRGRSLHRESAEKLEVFTRGLDDVYAKIISLLLEDFPVLMQASRAGNELGKVGAELLRLRLILFVAIEQFQVVGCLEVFVLRHLLPEHAQQICEFENKKLRVATDIAEGSSQIPARAEGAQAIRSSQESVQHTISMMLQDHPAARETIGEALQAVERGAYCSGSALGHMLNALGMCGTTADKLLAAVADSATVPASKLLHEAKGVTYKVDMLLKAGKGVPELWGGILPLFEHMDGSFRNVAMALQELT